MKRNTHQQDVITAALLALKGTHPTADTVYAHVRQNIPSISKATVYRILNQLAQEGAIQRLHIPHAADCYDNRLGQHYHMRCTACGQVTDIELPVLLGLCEKISQTHDCQVHGHDISFYGLCKACTAYSKTN